MVYARRLLEVETALDVAEELYAQVALCPHVEGDFRQRCVPCHWRYSGDRAYAGHEPTYCFFDAANRQRQVRVKRLAWVIANRQALPSYVPVFQHCYEVYCVNPYHLSLVPNTLEQLPQVQRVLLMLMRESAVQRDTVGRLEARLQRLENRLDNAPTIHDNQAKYTVRNGHRLLTRN